MTTQEKLDDAKKDLVKAQDQINGLKAKLYLDELQATATYTSSTMISYDKKYTEPQKLFADNDILYYVEDGRLALYIRRQARHFKDMDDSQSSPLWQKEAIKQARRYQAYYDKYIRTNY